MPSRKRLPNTLNVVSLFAGGGGLDLGLEAAGFRTALATDIDSHSCITLRQLGSYQDQEPQTPPIVLRADISDLDPVAAVKAADLRPGAVNVLAGGPPCQAFSVFGKRRGLADKRGILAFEYLRVLGQLQPEAFVFENVFGLLTIDGGRLLETILEQLSRPRKDLRYELSVHRLNAVDFGVPQYRDRVFIIGHKGRRTVRAIPPWVGSAEDLDLLSVDLPKRRTVRDALRGLPPIGTHSLANHTGRDHSLRIVERYRSLKPGERDPKTRINRLDLDKPSFTIIVGSDKGGGKGHVHPTEPREVTPRESARIQTFPDAWAFSGTSRHPIRQVGNAVPPLMAAAIGNALRTQIFGEPGLTLAEAAERLGQEHLFSPRSELERGVRPAAERTDDQPQQLAT